MNSKSFVFCCREDLPFSLDSFVECFGEFYISMDIYSLGVFFSYSIRLLILGVQQECACLSSFTKPSYCLSLFIQKKTDMHPL